MILTSISNNNIHPRPPPQSPPKQPQLILPPENITLHKCHPPLIPTKLPSQSLPPHLIDITYENPQSQQPEPFDAVGELRHTKRNNRPSSRKAPHDSLADSARAAGDEDVLAGKISLIESGGWGDGFATVEFAVGGHGGSWRWESWMRGSDEIRS